MPRTKKAAGTAVDPRNGRRADLVVVPGEALEPPPGLCDEALAQWRGYWDDAVSGVLTPADRSLVVRWITETDRYLRLIAEADREPVVRGSQGQPVENPLYGTAYKAMNVIQQCERQLGMGPLNRSALGIAVITERKSLADMNARYGGGQHDRAALHAVPEQDPRIIEA